MNKKTAQKIALKIANDLEGPLGRIPMGRVVEKHIAFFNELRAEGASWPQIADLLADAGVTRKDGKPMAASQLRSTISRISLAEPVANSSNQPTSQPPHPPPVPPPGKTGNNPNPKSSPTSRDSKIIRQKMQRASQARKTKES